MAIVVVLIIVLRRQQMQIFGKKKLIMCDLIFLIYIKSDTTNVISFSLSHTQQNYRGDFCPYVHTGPNSGKYRHPHVALAALELWFGNKCNPEMCHPEWLKTPNAKDYGVPERSTSITWAEMIDNDDPMSQPVVPYKWPNSGSGSYPGHELYGGLAMKPVDGVYVTDKVTSVNPSSTSGAGHVRRGVAVSSGLLVTAMISYVVIM